MATTFHYFPRLPPEIRIAIWKFCLPNRVTELVYPDNSDYCQLRHASSLNSKPPIISRVCHESRQVAFGEGGFLGDLYAPGDEGWDAFHSRNFDRRLWITPTAGTLHLNLAKETEIGHESNIKNLSALKAILAGGEIKTVSIASSLILTFRKCVIWRIAFMDDYFLRLDPKREWLATLATVSLHVPRDAAIQSGLFGRLGDERITLVDAFDHDRIQQYYRLWLQESKIDMQTRRFFLLAISKPFFHRQIRSWSDDLETLWIANKYYYEQHDDPLGIWEGIEDIFSRLEALTNGLREERLDKGHPWVKEKLKSMPILRPMIMFRLCPFQCCSLPCGSASSDIQSLQISESDDEAGS